MRNLCVLFLVGLATGFISEKLLVASQSPTFDLYIEGRSSGDLPIDDEDAGDDGSGSGSGDYPFNFPVEKDEVSRSFVNLTETSLPDETLPLQPQPTAGAPHNPTTTAADSQDSVTTARDSETTPSIFPDESDRPEKMPGGEEEESMDPTSSSSDMTTSATSQADIGMETDNYDLRHSPEVPVSKKDRHDQGTSFDDVGSSGKVTSDNLWERTDVLAAVIACGVVGLLCAIFLLTLLAYRMKKKDEGSYDLGDNKLSTTAYHKAPTKEFYA
ncbi:syndecan-2-like [Mugil cephalus]|uniref:syndecan-2-like n=1 Tax=Mugil cephalus TaxID=48193 RepID=UPI001FB683CE|nr:syndecan-2-like [Mugil cephalus]